MVADDDEASKSDECGPRPWSFGAFSDCMHIVLQQELQHVEEHCQSTGETITVQLASGPRSGKDVQRFINDIPANQKHRLHTWNDVDLCYRTLRFSCTHPPIPTLGMTGDIWIVSTPGSEAVFYHSGSGWVPWTLGTNAKTAHPFFGPLVELHFLVDQLLWSAAPIHTPMYAKKWLVANYRRPDSAKYEELTVPDVVRHLYFPNGALRGERLHSTLNVYAYGPGSRGMKRERSVSPVLPHSPTPTPEPHPKRQRLSSMSSSLLDGCTRHTIFWYEDGSVVLKVERTLFRLSRTYLQRHSGYFADLFAGEHALATFATLEECPVVDVPGVSAVDFETWFATVENGL